MASTAGKLGAWPSYVSLPADTPLSSHRADSRTSDPRVDALETVVLPLLQQQAGDLAERWTIQARSMLLLDGTDRQTAARMSDARGLVEALIAGFAGRDSVSEDATGHGMR